MRYHVVPLLYGPVASAEPIHTGAGDSASDGYQPDLLQDVPDQGHHMLTRWQDSINPDLPPPLKIPMTNNNEALFQLPHAPVGGKVLFNHLKYNKVLQVGIHVAWNTKGSRWIVSFPRTRTESSHSNISGSSLTTTTTSYVSRRCTEGMSISRLFRCWLRFWTRKCSWIGHLHPQGSSS